MIDTEVMTRWSQWARWAKAQARLLSARGDTFDARLKAARGEVRRQASMLLRSAPDVGRAARLMMRYAVAASVRTAPLIGYDEAAISYTVARTWQACAWELDPDLPEVQARWT